VESCAETHADKNPISDSTQNIEQLSFGEASPASKRKRRFICLLLVEEFGRLIGLQGKGLQHFFCTNEVEKDPARNSNCHAHHYIDQG